MNKDFRKSLSQLMVLLIVAGIAIVFVFTGVISPDPALPGAIAGKVNGEAIRASEYNRALRQRMEFMKGMKFSPDQMRQFGIHTQVFNGLVTQKLIAQEAEAMGIEASIEEVRDEIKKIPAFIDGGRFDTKRYQQILRSNGMTSAGFERDIRRGILTQRWQDYFRNGVKVSDAEITREYRTNNDKRQFKYVLITRDAAKKGIKVSSKEISDFIKNKDNKKKMDDRFALKKNTVYKGKQLKDVEREIAKELVSESKAGEVRKITDDLAKKVEAKLATGSVTEILKPFGLKVQETKPVSRRESFIPGVGEVPDLLKDAFAGNAKKPRKYFVASGTLVAHVTKSEKPDMAKFSDEERAKVRQTLLQKKERSLFDAWLTKARSSAQITANQEVIENF